MLPKGLAVLYDLIAIWNMDYSAIIVGQFFNHPGYFSRSDPLLSPFQFLVATDVDSIDELLYFGEWRNWWYFEVILDIKPRQNGL